MSHSDLVLRLVSAVRKNLVVAGGVSLLLVPSVAKASSGPAEDYHDRVESVRDITGLAAFWDFVLREDGVGGRGRFLAYTARGDTHRYLLEPHNLAWDYWREGNDATLEDFPLLGRGPFGQAVHFQSPAEVSRLPVLSVARTQLHDTPLDIKGPGRSVSMVAWLIHQEGNHAIAGIWHEGTTTSRGVPALVKETGRRQFALFAGMGGNPGGVGAHLSENGLGSFGDVYARHLAVTPEKMRSVAMEATPEALDSGWSVAGFVFDADTRVVTAYLDGVANERWVENPAKDRFYRAAERAWRQAQLAKISGLQEGEDESFSPDQFYDPPTDQLVREEIVAESDLERTVVRTYSFTKVRLTSRKQTDGTWGDPESIELLALKTNPYWFGHTLFIPAEEKDGGPFTIGRVVHSGRGGRLTAYLGGVAVYGRALTPDEMLRLSTLAREPTLRKAEIVPSADKSLTVK